MKCLTLLLGFCAVLLPNVSVALEDHRVPVFQRLDAVAGSHSESEEFKRLLRDYQFSANPKRDNSWGSGFGVFLERLKKRHRCYWIPATVFGDKHADLQRNASERTET